MHKQYVSSVANLRSLRANKAECCEFAAERASIAGTAFANRVFAVAAGRTRAGVARSSTSWTCRASRSTARRPLPRGSKDSLGASFEAASSRKARCWFSTRSEAPLASALFELTRRCPTSF